MTRKGHGIHPIELKKPYGIGFERWRRMKRLWKDHTPAIRGVIFASINSKLLVVKKRSLNEATGESYG
jgi:hypothetical protein